MDPDRRFRVEKLAGEMGETNWNQTVVQENVGLHPIWNESFFIPLPHLFPE